MVTNTADMNFCHAGRRNQARRSLRTLAIQRAKAFIQQRGLELPAPVPALPAAHLQKVGMGSTPVHSSCHQFQQSPLTRALTFAFAVFMNLPAAFWRTVSGAGIGHSAVNTTNIALLHIPGLAASLPARFCRHPASLNRNQRGSPDPEGPVRGHERAGVDFG